MITGLVSLAGVDLDDNLQLAGPAQSQPIAYSVRDLLGGNQVVQIDQKGTGTELVLNAIYEGTKRQGQWCQYQIDLLKTASTTGLPQTLNYHGETHQVYILDFSALVETNERELPDPYKKFHGPILLQKT